MKGETKNKSEKEVFSLIKRMQSFEHAGRGIKIFLKTTHNAWVEIFFGIGSILLGFYFGISPIEWLFVGLSIGIVLTAEAFNTAIEFDIDLTSPEYHPYAKYTKDIAAGAVLISSITAIIVGLVIFIPKILVLLTS